MKRLSRLSVTKRSVGRQTISPPKLKRSIWLDTQFVHHALSRGIRINLPFPHLLGQLFNQFSVYFFQNPSEKIVFDERHELLTTEILHPLLVIAARQQLGAMGFDTGDEIFDSYILVRR